MNWLDILFVILLGTACIKGCFRGLVRELASLAGLVIGFFAANVYAPRVQPLVESLVDQVLYAQIVSYALVFVAVMIFVLLCSAVLRRLVSAGGLSGLDRLLGGLFGLLKAGLASCLILLLLTATLSPRSDLLSTSRLAPFFQNVSRVLTLYLPDGLRQRMVEKSGSLRQVWEKDLIGKKANHNSRNQSIDQK